MTTISRSLSTLAVLAALTMPAFAQDTTTPDPAPADETPPSVFNMGEELDANGNPVTPETTEPQVGEQYLREVFNDWAVRCLKTEEEQDPCQMYQLLLDDNENAVAEIAIVVLPDSSEAAAGATIVVPLETLLTEQLTMRVDGGTARRFPFNFCNRGGCVSRIGLTADDIGLFRRGAAATLTMAPAAAPDQRVSVTMSLSGFTAAYEAASQQ